MNVFKRITFIGIILLVIISFAFSKVITSANYPKSKLKIIKRAESNENTANEIDGIHDVDPYWIDRHNPFWVDSGNSYWVDTVTGEKTKLCVYNRSKYGPVTGTCMHFKNCKTDNIGYAGGICPGDSDISCCLVEDPNEKPEIVLKSVKASELKQKFGKKISEFAKEHGIDENLLGGLILTESRGLGFENEKMKIRFEVSKFLSYDENKEYNGKYFKTNKGVRYYRMKEEDNWKIINGDNQKMNYDAFELALWLDPETACKATSFGMAQIMGFNYKTCGYDSALEMYYDFKKGDEIQYEKFLDFILNYPTKLEGKTLLEYCQAGEERKMIKLYNGDGNVDEYQQKYDTYKKEYQDS